jgi:iron(III) transport system ATP-binding protein
MSAIELTNVRKAFGATPVLDDISLTVPEGSRTVVVGASGSGKTTLLRLISGFEFPDAGTITIHGRTVAGPGTAVPGTAGPGTAVPAHRRGIGYVAQDGALFPQLTVGQNIAFGLGAGLTPARRLSRRRAVDDLLEMVSLDPAFAARRPDELSGGQQQRVALALARALARRPRVMLLDEPFSSLDAGLRAATRDAVAATLDRAGITTVLVTHDQAEAMSFADQLAVLREGRLCQVGSPRELYARPRDLHTARFLGDAIVLPAIVTDGVARCALGLVPVTPGAPAGAGSVMLRPEQIVVGEASGAEAVTGRVTGRVENVDFFGSEAQLTVRLAVPVTVPLGWASVPVPGGADVIRVRQMGSDGTTVGSQVSLTVRGTAVAFPADAVPA